MAPTRLVACLKPLVPVRWRLALRRKAREIPQRWRDLPRDAASVLLPSAFGGPIPPPALRARVGGISRREFRAVGQEGAAQILRAFERARDPGRSYPLWLDFGCGCGRIARWLTGAPPLERLRGVDVDAKQIAWSRRHLDGDFSVMPPTPPLPFPPESFDVVYAISIFTHLDEQEQFGWLGDLGRVVRPGGLLVATTHGPNLAPTCPGLNPAHLAALGARGFLFADPKGTFNERTTFHSRAYLEAEWGRFWTLRLFESAGFVSYQDLSVWEKPADR